MSPTHLRNSDWTAAGHDVSALLQRLSPAHGAHGPTTAFMDLALECEVQEQPSAEVPPGEASGEPSGMRDPAQPSLPERAIAHLGAALRHEREGVARGWAWFEARWETGRVLQAQLVRACLAAGPQPVAAIQDEDTGRWIVETVDLARSTLSAQRVVADLLEIYEAIGVGALLMPECRRHPEYAGTVVLASVLSALEAKDVGRALAQVLRAEGWLDPALWDRLETPRSLGRLLDFLASPALRRLLGRTVGARRAARCYARMMTRLVPGLGRKLLMADVLTLVFEQWNGSAEPPLRSLQSVGPRHLAMRSTLTGCPR